LKTNYPAVDLNIYQKILNNPYCIITSE